MTDRGRDTGRHDGALESLEGFITGEGQPDEWLQTQQNLLEYWDTFGDPSKTRLITATYDFAAQQSGSDGELSPESARYVAIRRLTTAASNGGDTDLLTVNPRADKPAIELGKNAAIYGQSGIAHHEVRAAEVIRELWSARTPEFVGLAISSRYVNARDALDVASHLADMTDAERVALRRELFLYTDSKPAIRDEAYSTIAVHLLKQHASKPAVHDLHTLYAIAASLDPRNWDSDRSHDSMASARGTLFDAMWDYPFASTDREQDLKSHLRNVMFEHAPTHWVRRADFNDLDALQAASDRALWSIGNRLTQVAYSSRESRDHLAKLLVGSESGLSILEGGNNFQLLAMCLPILDARRSVELIGDRAFPLALMATALAATMAHREVNDSVSAFTKIGVITPDIAEHVLEYAAHVKALVRHGSFDQGPSPRDERELLGGQAESARSRLRAYIDASRALAAFAATPESLWMWDTSVRLQTSHDAAYRNFLND